MMVQPANTKNQPRKRDGVNNMLIAKGLLANKLNDDFSSQKGYQTPMTLLFTRRLCKFIHSMQAAAE